jgi:predicted metal-dependent peptidase
MKAQKEWDVATPTDIKTIPIIIDHSEEPSTISVESGIINKMTEPIKILRIYAYENVVEEADKYVRKRMRDMRNPVWLKKKLR